MSVDHAKLHALRGDLALRPLSADAVRLANLLVDVGSACPRIGAAEFGALSRLHDLGLADRHAGDDGYCRFTPSAFMDELCALGLLGELGMP